MTITVNGVTLFYEKSGTGKPIVLLHGNGENHTIFREFTAQLSKHYTVYALDSRCHGHSEKTKQLTYHLMAEDTRCLIEQLGLKKPIVYGYSDGGIIGLLLAIQYPDLLSRLIISGANLTPSGMGKRFVRHCKLVHFFTRSKLWRLMAYEPNIDVAELSQIKIPVLVLAGEHDLILEEHTRMIASHIPNSVLKILPGEDHGSYVVHSEKLYEVVRKFLPECGPRT
ncbi:MAG TPA: alpha/beta hydrolase [Firmicutes bacterium]|nr:alpha/beta hydrolase [Bacillota bacterium]